MAKIKNKYLKDPDLSSRYDFDLRKCVHVRLFTRTKNELDIMKLRLNLPLQEIFECMAQAIIDEDPYIIKMLNEYRIRRENRETQKFLNEYDEKTLLEEIEKNDPFKQGNE